MEELNHAHSQENSLYEQNKFMSIYLGNLLVNNIQEKFQTAERCKKIACILLTSSQIIF